jgi:cation diffusion facilitator CzcD-associated flavoprotein CzcO
MHERLAELTARARSELALITAYPGKDWVEPMRTPSGEHVYDVVIVGAGQAGLAVAHALQKDRVRNILVLDRNPAGFEGPWETYARMAELRTPKHVLGMEFGLPSLSVRRWYEARHGLQAWDDMERMPRLEWMEYLRWYRRTLCLPVRNEANVSSIAHNGRCLTVDVDDGGRRALLARHVVLATGFDGHGSWKIPDFLASAIPASHLSHSNVPIDFTRLSGKRVGILGHGASAFDAAVGALEAGARSVDLCYRRERIPVINPHRWLESSGLLKHYPDLADDVRWALAHQFDLVDQPPMQMSYDTAQAHPRFVMHPASPWQDAQFDSGAIRVRTQSRVFTFDFVIAATGSMADLAARPELAQICDRILLWRERYNPPESLAHTELERFPYLGRNFELRPRAEEDAWLSRIYAYNYSALVSHGPNSNSITGHRYAVPRLVEKVTRDLLSDQAGRLVPDLRAYDEAELKALPNT